MMYLVYDSYIEGFLSALVCIMGKPCRNLPQIYIPRLIGEIYGRL